MRRLVFRQLWLLLGVSVIFSCNKDSVVVHYEPAPDRLARETHRPGALKQPHRAAPARTAAHRAAARRPEEPTPEKFAPIQRVKLASLMPARLAGTPLQGRMDGLLLGAPVTYNNLTIYPVLSEQPSFGKIVFNIDESFEGRKLAVTEAGSGSVPFIELNKSTREHVFVMTGEMFIGAKQDRISKHDVILPPRKGTFKLPVYCVEQGRWHGSSMKFKSGNVVSSQSLRKSAVRKGSQGQIWDKVAVKTRQVKATTSTQTMHASYRSKFWRQKAPAYMKVFKLFAKGLPKSVGVLVVINKAIVSFDVFLSHRLFTGLWPKLLKAIVLDAIDPHFKGSPFHQARARAFFGMLSGAKFKKTQTPGMGREYLIASKELTGTVLVAKNRLVHFALFPEKEQRLRKLATQAKGALPAAPPSYKGYQVPVQPNADIGNLKGSLPEGKRYWRKGYKRYRGHKRYRSHKRYRGNKARDPQKRYRPRQRTAPKSPSRRKWKSGSSDHDQ
ncbi:MAG: DUF6569 family protein [bacterium]